MTTCSHITCNGLALEQNLEDSNFAALGLICQIRKKLQALASKPQLKYKAKSWKSGVIYLTSLIFMIWEKLNRVWTKFISQTILLLLEALGWTWELLGYISFWLWTPLPCEPHGKAAAKQDHIFKIGNCRSNQHHKTGKIAFEFDWNQHNKELQNKQDSKTGTT